MPKLVQSKKISLKSRPDINEEMVKKFIFENTSVLGLGDLEPLSREKLQPTGGYVDILLGDEDDRYEIEVQLGATDPSHIIRTIEYWDIERKRTPQYNHCAVIIAEDITNRFMNVINLFNGAIPLIAYKMTAIDKGNDEVELDFIKIIDRNEIITEEEQYEPTDRQYWEKKSTPKMLKQVDEIYSFLGELVKGFEFKYNKFYIGLAEGGIAKNFISFKPKKKYLYFVTKGTMSEEIISKLEEAGLDVSYENRWKEYNIKLNGIEDFKEYSELLITLVKNGRKFYDID
ncbi:MAG: hypothetical protein K6E11_04625 [Bacilli bacterium]|nr:hypothetical protein [Bacilli bacterium]